MTADELSLCKYPLPPLSKVLLASRCTDERTLILARNAMSDRALVSCIAMPIFALQSPITSYQILGPYGRNTGEHWSIVFFDMRLVNSQELVTVLTQKPSPLLLC